MPGARDRDFLYPNILCLEHHVPIPYGSFTNPKLQDLFFLLRDSFFPIEFFFSLRGFLLPAAGPSWPYARRRRRPAAGPSWPYARRRRRRKAAGLLPPPLLFAGSKANARGKGS